jgi:DivIVA domain-containing protein
MKRSEIVRTDFPTSRKGYDRAAVDAHLREIADAVERQAPADASRAEAAGAKVTEIIELAERKAAEIEAEARKQASEIVERAESEAREQVDRGQEAVSRLIKQADELRSTVGSLGRGISEGLTGRPAAETEPGPVVVPEPAVPEPEVDPSPVTVPEPEPPLEPEPEPPAIPEPEPGMPEQPEADGGSPSTDDLIAQLKGGDNGDAAAARLVAMNMVLNGSPRAEIEKHLADHFDLGDAKQLLDEVYARVAG